MFDHCFLFVCCFKQFKKQINLIKIVNTHTSTPLVRSGIFRDATFDKKLAYPPIMINKITFYVDKNYLWKCFDIVSYHKLT